MGFAEAIRSQRQVLDDLHSLEADFKKASTLLVRSLTGGGPVLACGNGGSACDAAHFAGELVGRFLVERGPLPAISLGGELASVTAIANDYGYEQVFARQVKAHARPSALLVALSTSGNSENVLRAAEAAKGEGLSVIALTGKGGGKLASLADCLLAVPSDQTPRIQEAHILILHCLCEAADRELAS